MSMYISVSTFKKQGGKLDANYSNISKEVVITDFLDSLIPEEYILFFTAFEENDELKYREIKKEDIYKISKEIDRIADELFSELIKTSGKSKREEITSKIIDINLLNQLIKTFLFNEDVSDSGNTKILIS